MCGKCTAAVIYCEFRICVFALKFGKESVKDIVRWALTAQLPKEAYLGSEYIMDVREYVKSSIRDINLHYPDPLYNTAIIGLYRLRELVERMDG